MCDAKICTDGEKMDIKKSAVAGTLESNDVFVEIEESDTLKIEIESIVYAQFGEDICEAVELCDENGYAKAEKCDNDSFISKQCYKISTKSGTFKAADYASCGQTWDPEKIMTVWVTTK